jgi:YesN/AraC family two-component response regulator
MTLSTEFVFLTNEIEGFKLCRETRAQYMTTALLCLAGHIDVFYQGKMIRIAKDDIFIRVPHATELGPYEISKDFKFMQISIPVDLFDELMFDHMRVEPNWWQKLEYLKANPIFHLSKVSIDFCITYFHLLTLQLQDHQSDYRRQIMMLIARATTMEMLNYLDKMVTFSDAEQRKSVNSSDYIFRTFTQMLREHPHQREVQWYAQELSITPKYLSEICKERSGKSASEWIAEVTITELKHYLRNTTLPIHEVAKIMEFPNASFFCQYTKKHTGLTPNHFRKEKEQ